MEKVKVKNYVNLMIFIIAINIDSLLASESWHFRLGNYICTFFDGGKKKLPLIDAITDYGNENIKEFDPRYVTANSLWNYCVKLDFVEHHSWWPFSTKIKKKYRDLLPLSSKDRSLLVFAQTMVAHEAEWKEWHTFKKLDGGRKFHEASVIYMNGNVVKDRKIRQDSNSPYYEGLIITQEMQENQLSNYWLTMNALENEAYHDELKFLQTQLHKLELYWGMKSEVEKNNAAAQNDYNRTHTLLKSEIASFKKSENRPVFTRLCMKKKDFEDIQKMRNAYKAPSKYATLIRLRFLIFLTLLQLFDMIMNNQN